MGIEVVPLALQSRRRIDKLLDLGSCDWNIFVRCAVGPRAVYSWSSEQDVKDDRYAGYLNSGPISKGLAGHFGSSTFCTASIR